MRILILESQLKQIIEGEFMYHVGDIDANKEIKPYGSDNIVMMSGRGTGHFGSGLYFSTYNCKGWGAEYDFADKYGDNYDANKHYLTKVDNRLYRVKTDLYQNLYRVNNYEQGKWLHDTLKYINSLVSYSRYVEDVEINYDMRKPYPIIKHNMERLGLKVPIYKEFVVMLKKANDDIKKYNTGNVPDRRSLSTRIMEFNDYNGVNVSGIKELDNTMYGSVIYDINNISRDFQPVSKNEVGSYCTMQNNLIVNKQEFRDTPEQNIMRLITGENLNPITIQRIPSKYITFFFNRYPYFLSNVDLSFLPEHYRNVYFKSLTRKLKANEMKSVENNMSKYLKPIIHHNLNIIMNPTHLYEGYSLLYWVLSKDYQYDDEKEIIPILNRIKETGRRLSSEEQKAYDEIKEQ